MKNINIKEISLEEVFEIHKNIPEFMEESPEISYFQDKLGTQDYTCIGGYLDTVPAGYMIAYDKYQDGSLYCWMAGVIPEYRKSGILYAMVQYLESLAKDQGYNSLSITTRNTRREMLSFLVKSNFLFLEVQKYNTEQENRIHLKKYI